MARCPNFRFVALAGAVVMAIGGLTPMRAQEVSAQDQDDQRRGVARISLMDGEVSVRRGDSGDWVAGVINAPLMSDDRIATGPNSRAEVQFDSSNLMRIGGNVEVRLAQLEAARFQMELARGTMTYVVLRPSSANAEVDTPSVSVRPSRQGVYRIAVKENGDTQVIVRSGEVEVFTPRGSEWVNAGQMMVARGTASDPEFQIVTAIGLDDWDRWNQVRDEAMTRSASYQYVPQGVYGAEDLDAYGSWANVPPYGYCWRPNAISAGWAPYGAGRWVWEDWYGWTWVSYDPWGWAPYHYGRWFNNGGLWWWYPGVIGVRHFWSPALVAFFGFGRGVGFGFGFGNIGWVPLAPYEVFHPWWGRGYYGGGGFNRNINITNVNITNVYRNARVVNGVSAVNVNDFHNGRFTNISRVPGTQVNQAGLIRGQMPMGPNSANLRFSDRQVTNAPRVNESARFFSHQQVNPVQRLPFAQQQRAFEQNGRGPQTTAGSGPAARPAGNPSFRNQAMQSGADASQAARTPQGNSGGWRRFGEPGGQSGAPANQGGGFRGGASSPALQNTRPPNASAPASRGGWSRFGAPGGASPAPAQPRSNFQGGSNFGGSRYSTPGGGQGSIRVAPPVVRERPSMPSYNAPRPSAPSYSGPRGGGFSAPRQSAPSYSAPRGGGGGGGRPSGGGGGHSGGGGHGGRR
jgi:hypothetical protein